MAVRELDDDNDERTLVVLCFVNSSKELGFFNPRSQLDSTIVTYWPMQLKNGEDR